MMRRVNETLVWLGAVAVIATALPTTAVSAEKDIIVRNTSAEPVPVAIPRWQGVPYVGEVNRTSVDSFTCGSLTQQLPSGKTLYVVRVVARFDVAPGESGGAQIVFWPLDETAPRTVAIPSHPSAPARREEGTYDGYEGSLDIGFPIQADTTPQGCFRAGPDSDLTGTIWVLGYLVDPG